MAVHIAIPELQALHERHYQFGRVPLELEHEESVEKAVALPRPSLGASAVDQFVSRMTLVQSLAPIARTQPSGLASPVDPQQPMAQDPQAGRAVVTLSFGSGKSAFILGFLTGSGPAGVDAPASMTGAERATQIALLEDRIHRLQAELGRYYNQGRDSADPFIQMRLEVLRGLQHREARLLREQFESTLSMPLTAGQEAVEAAKRLLERHADLLPPDANP